MYPRFNTMMKDGIREFGLDVEVAASGFSKGDRKQLEEYMAEVAREAGSDNSEEEEHSDDEVEEEQTDATPQVQETVVPIATLVLAEEPMTLENLHLHSVAMGNTASGDENDDEDDDATSRASDSDEDDRSTTADSTVSSTASHRRHRPSTRTPAPTSADVGAIVTERLARSKKSTEKKHHGKKPASSNVLGKQKGSKMRMDSRRNIKESQDF